MQDDIYQPISCSDYDIYEIAIMGKRDLLLLWQDDQGVQEKRVKPLELKIVDRAEFLVFESAEKILMELRLDKIQRAYLCE